MSKRPIIGLLGGGQLGRMLQEAASPLDIEVIVLDTANCPMRQINANPKHVTGSFNDPAKIRELARRCDVLTVEIEHVNTEVLEEIATKGVLLSSGEYKKVPVHPSWETIAIIQDKYLQKEHLGKVGIPVAQQLSIDSDAPLRDVLPAIAQEIGYPFMLKARKGSYDGRGNFVVRTQDDLYKAIASGGDLPLYAEKWIAFEKELAVIVVRTEDGEGDLRSVYTFPAVETIHEDSICTKVFYPPRHVPADISEKAMKVAAHVIRTLKGRGVFAVEMFLLEDGTILVNEVAPRPHNSGHLFTEAIPSMSQFKAHLLSICDKFPRAIKLQPRVSAAMMLNILGGVRGDSHNVLINRMETLDDDDLDIFLHLYGKISRPGRKIGHITITSYAPTLDIEELVAPLTKKADSVREERLKAASTQSQSLNARATSQTSSILPSSSRDTKNPLVIMTMGSDSDLSILEAAFEILERFSVPYDFTITSAHRTPHRMVELGKSAAQRGVRVLIAAAGGAAHLPGMLASETTVPVIGVPIKASHLDGHDSLLSIVQMPRGCPVATVGINNSANAAFLAIKILGSFDEVYRYKMAEYMKDMSNEVERKAMRLRNIGWKAYLDEE